MASLLDPLADPAKVAAAPQMSEALPDYTKPTTTGALPASSFDVGALKASAGTPVAATTYKPSEEAMVSQQLGALLSGDNPYITRARARAAQVSNRRGLLNSSMAAGAGEAAAIDAALPIAQQDASTHFQAQRDNAAAQNTFSLDENRFTREGALAALNARFNAENQARDQAFRAGESAAARAQSESQFGRDLALKERATDLDAAIKTGQLKLQEAAQALDEKVRTGQLTLDQAKVDFAKMQATAEAVSQLQAQYLNARNALETTPNLDPAAKANAINAMSTWYAEQVLAPIRAMYGNPDAWPTAPAPTVAAGDLTAPGTPVTTPGGQPANPANPLDPYDLQPGG